jgi:hypothetical protein
MPTTSDFSGVLTIKAPDATAANNAAGKQVLEATSSYTFLSLGPITVGGSTAQNELIAVTPMFPFNPKVIKNVVKTAGTAWVAGQAIYLITATGVFITTSGTGKVLFGIAAADATSAATVGDLLPCQPR